VAFLPKEFTGTEERLRVLEFPTDNVAPLVQTEGQVTVGLDPLGVGGVHDGFGGGTDSDGFGQVGLTTVSKRKKTIPHDIGCTLAQDTSTPIELLKTINKKEGRKEQNLRLGNPSDFRSETFNVVLLPLQGSAGDKHGEIAILDTHILDGGSKEL
jgi:hypothetical protein